MVVFVCFFFTSRDNEQTHRFQATYWRRVFIKATEVVVLSLWHLTRGWKRSEFNQFRCHLRPQRLVASVCARHFHAELKRKIRWLFFPSFFCCPFPRFLSVFTSRWRFFLFGWGNPCGRFQLTCARADHSSCITLIQIDRRLIRLASLIKRSSLRYWVVEDRPPKRISPSKSS